MPKYIISSGCSYTVYLDAFRKKFASDAFYFKNNVRFISLGSEGAANNHIVETTIHAVSSLLKSGVSPKDIFVLVDFTQIGRISKKIPSHFNEDFDSSIVNIEKKYLSNPNIQKINDDLQISRWSGWVKINDTVYSLMQNTTDRYFPKYFKEWDELIRFSYRGYIDVIEEYFNSIILLQTYLKFVGVDYRSFFMNNVVEGWYYEKFTKESQRFNIPWISNKFLNLDRTLKHKYSIESEYKVPNLSDSLHVKQLSPLLNATFDMIDFSKFILYKTEGNNFGGIDEFVIDNFPKEYFIDINTGQGHGCTGPVYGMHPNAQAHETYVDRFLVDTIKNFLGSNNE